MPITRNTGLGPNLSNAHPPMTEVAAENSMYIENSVDVIERVHENSVSSEVKKMPNEYRIPIPTAKITKQEIRTTQL
jgi:hypothetical protein